MDPSASNNEHLPLLGTAAGIKDPTTANPPFLSPLSVNSTNGVSHYGALKNDTPLAQQQQTYFRRRRLYYLILLLLLLVLLLTVVILVARHQALKYFEQGIQLEFQTTSIEKVTTTSTGQEILTLHLVGTVALVGPASQFAHRLTAIFGAIQVTATRLYVAPNMGTILLPALTLSSGVTSLDFVTEFIVAEDPAPLITFCKAAMMGRDEIGWWVTGSLPATVGWLPLQNHVPLKKWISIDGMEGLTQTEMTNMEFPGSHPLGGIALQGMVGIYNPSRTLSMTLGDVDFGIYLDGDNGDEQVMIAVVRAEDMQLSSQRKNYFKVTGRTLPLDDKDIKKRQYMETFLTRYLHGNASIVRVRGNAFGPDDEITLKLPDWLQQTLRDMTLTLPFPGTTQPQLIQSLVMDHLQIDFSTSLTGPPFVSGDTLAVLHLPKELQIDPVIVAEILPDALLFLDPDHPPIARLTPSKPCPSTSQQSSSVVTVTSRINHVPLEILDQGGFDTYLATIYRGHNTTIYIRGTTSALVSSDLGKLKVDDLSFHGQIKTTGLQGMKHPAPKVTSLEIIQGYVDALQVQPRLVIANPSNLDLNLGTITFKMLYKDSQVGNVTIQPLNLPHGTSQTFDSASYIFATPVRLRGTCGNPDAPSATLLFIGDYISGRQTELVIAGHHGNKYLGGLMPLLVFTVQVPRFREPPLLQAIQMNILSSTALVWLRNPFQDIDMRISTINASALYEDALVGTMTADFTAMADHSPLALPPVVCDHNECNGLVVVTPKIPVALKKFGLDLISKALGGTLILTIDSIVNVMIDSFSLTDLHYTRDNITAIIKKSF